MSNNQETNPAAQQPAYSERIEQQEAVVRDIEAQYQKKPSPALQLDLRRKTDTLRHVKNLAKGSPKERARKAAETAKIATLRKAISMPQ